MLQQQDTTRSFRDLCAPFASPPWMALLLVMLFGQYLCAQFPLPIAPTGGSSSRSNKKKALSTIPYGSLTPSAAQRIRAVVNQPSLYRRLPIKTIDSDPQLFVFLIRNPEVVVDIWQQMGVTQLTLERVSDYRFQSSDGVGTDSQIDLVYGTPNLHIYYGTGVYEGPLFKQKIRGECVLLLRTDYGNADGRSTVCNRLDVFMKIDQGAVDLVAKSIAPLFGRTADINFTETSGFLSKLSLAAESSGPRMRNIAAKMRTVSPSVKEQFVRVASTVGDRAGASAGNSRIARPIPGRRPGSIRPASAQVNSPAKRVPILDSRIEMPVLR